MIEAKELKIGNWVEVPTYWGNVYEGDENVQVEEILYNEINHEAVGINGSCNTGFNEIKPIELTEEWMIKFGFKKWKSKGITYSKGKFIIHLRKRGWVINKRIVDPKYVHQMQNLFFAMTGTEI